MLMNEESQKFQKIKLHPPTFKKLEIHEKNLSINY